MISPAADRAVEEMVRELWDIEQIKQLKARYFRFLDGRDWASLRMLFTDDCVFESEGTRGVDGPDAFISRVKELITPGISVHQGFMPEITITGPDAATGVWAMHDYLEYEDRPGQRGLHGYGHYAEGYRRDAARGWLISEWRLTRLRVDRF